MLRRAAVLPLLVLISCLLAPLASAHSPQFPEGNDNLDQAMEVHDPTKSWAIYSELAVGGEVQYYALEMKVGEEIKAVLTVPSEYAYQGFLPEIAVMGPGIEDNGSLPMFVQRPEGGGVVVRSGILPERLEYEPFSPSAFYNVAEISLTAPSNGTYHLAVFDEHTGGHYGLAIGAREAFDVDEWLLIPFYTFKIYLWEGQSVLQIVAPSVTVLLITMVGMFLLSKRRGSPMNVMWVLLTVSGSLLIASAAMVISQMIFAAGQSGLEVTAIVTVMFATVAALLGLAALRVAHHDRGVRSIKRRERGWLIVIFLMGLLMWAGWIMGPALAVIAAVLPKEFLLQPLSRRR
jgi:hypothetical protein